MIRGADVLAAAPSEAPGRLAWDSDGLDWPNRGASRFVAAGGLRWHVQDAGTGPVCLLLHGTGASTHSWEGLLPLLAERHRVIAPDLPGHAFTDAPPDGDLSVAGMGRHLGALLAALDANPALVIGHSAGAVVAVWMTAHDLLAPRRLVAINGAFYPFPVVLGAVFGPLARLLAATDLGPGWFSRAARDPEAVARLLEGTGSHIDDRRLELYGRLFANREHVRSTLRMMAAWRLRGFHRWLRRVRAPLLLLAGAEDGMVPPHDSERVHRRRPGSRYVLLPGLGHLAHEEAPARVAAAILDDRAALPAVGEP